MSVNLRSQYYAHTVQYTHQCRIISAEVPRHLHEVHHTLLPGRNNDARLLLLSLPDDLLFEPVSPMPILWQMHW